MKRKSSKAWIITAVLIAMLVLIFAMVGCTPNKGGKDKDKDKDKDGTTYEAATALGEVLDAATTTLGKISQNKGELSLGLSIGVKGEKFKLNVDEDDVQFNVGGKDGADFDAKVKIGANFSNKDESDNEILAQVLLNDVVKLGVYSQDNVVYIEDGFTTAKTQKLMVSGAQDINYNKFLKDLPNTLKNLLSQDTLNTIAGLKNTVSSGTIGNVVGSLIKAKKTNDGVSLEVVFIDKDDPDAGLAPLLPIISTILEPPIDGLLDTYLPYILGGNFDDFKNNKVSSTSKISLDVGIKDGNLTGLGISIDLNPLASDSKFAHKDDVGGKITIDVGLNIDTKKDANLLPKDLDKYEEGALTANLALDIPNNEGLQFTAKIEFSPSLNDKDIKVKVEAKDKDGKNPIDLKAGYVNFGTDEEPQYAIAFDIGYLYEVSGAELPADGNTKYMYPLNIGQFLKNLITSQRVFVYFDEDHRDWWNSYYTAEFFKANGEDFTAEDLTSLNEKVINYYKGIYGDAAEDFEVEYRFSDGTLALAKDGTTGGITERKGENWHNLEITAIVNTPDREYVEMTFKGGDDDKTVIVKKGDSVDIRDFDPGYTADKGEYFTGWKIGEKTYKTLSAVEITGAGDITFTTDDSDGKLEITFKRYDMASEQFVDYMTDYFDLEDAKTNTITVKAGSLPDVPKIYGMDGRWATVSAKGAITSSKFDAQILSDDIDNSYTVISDTSKKYSVYPVYGIKEGTEEWTLAADYDIDDIDGEEEWKRSFPDYTNIALEKRFTRQTLNDGKITSIVEAGDPSLVGKDIVNTILGNLGDIFGIIGDRSVDMSFIAKIAGAISPYLANEDLIAARVRNIIKPVTGFDIVKYPYEMPESVAASDVAAIKADTKTLGNNSQASNLVDMMLNRSKNAVKYATYQRFVGIYGSLNEEAMTALGWDDTQIANYSGKEGLAKKAEAYVSTEVKNYGKNVKAAEAKIEQQVKDAEEYVLDFVKGYLGEKALDGATTVKEFLFGKGGNKPLVIAIEFKTPAETKGGYGVSVSIKRGSDTLAEISGDVFFSLRDDIKNYFTKADFEGAISVTEVREEGAKLSIVVEELQKISMAMGGKQIG